LIFAPLCIKTKWKKHSSKSITNQPLHLNFKRKDCFEKGVEVAVIEQIKVETSSSKNSNPQTAQPDKLTFVLPLRGARDIETTRVNLLPSIDRFFEGGDIDQLLVVGRAEEFPDFDFSDVVSEPLAARIRILDESDLLPPERGLFPLSGYDRQQVLKLTVSRYVRTPLYCTLDADLYMVRQCGLLDWWPGRKCIYNRDSMDIHPRWWRAAAKHLGYPLNFDRTQGFGVTPALLYTDIVAHLVQYLEKERKGVAHAIRHKATEYSLYWLYLLKNYPVDSLYSDDGPKLLGNPIWKVSDVGAGGIYAFIDRQFAPQDSYFMTVLQSSTGLRNQNVLEYIAARIKGR
jgi:hypothetical protein